MKQKLFGLSLILSVAIICLLIKCDNSPSKPVESESDYDIYFRDDLPDGKFFVFNTKQLAIVDSFDIPYWGSWPQLSADGRYMFCPDEKLSIVDMQTRQLVTQLYITGFFVVVSPDNRYFSLFLDSLQIFDAHTFQKIYSDTGGITNGKFTSDGKRLYCLKRYADIYCLNLNTTPFVSKLIDYPWASPSGVVASKDEKYLFVLGQGHDRSKLFQVYDINRDSVIFSFAPRLSGGIGEVNITPNGDLVVFADGEPNGGFEPPPASRTICIFNAKTFTMEAIVPTFGVDPDYPDGLPAWLTVITPDGRYFVSGGMGIIVIDLHSKRVAKLFEFPERYLQGITCRKIKK